MTQKLIWKTFKDTDFKPDHDYYWRGSDENDEIEMWTGKEIIGAYMSQGSRFPAHIMMYADAGKPSQDTVAARAKKKQDDEDHMRDFIFESMVEEDLSPEKTAERRNKVRDRYKNQKTDRIEHAIFLAEEELRNLKELLAEHLNR